VEETAEELYEDAPCGYLSTALDGTIQRANRTFLGWTGYAAEDIVGRKRFYDLLPPGAKIYYETHYAPLLQMQGAVREIALELVRADASRLPVLVNATTRQDDSGRAQSVRITVFDASDRRRYEQELLEARTAAEARAAAATALEHVAEGVVLADEDDRIRLLNPAAERILGVSEEDVRGLPISSVSPDWASSSGRIPVAGSDGRPVAPVIVPLTLEGRTRWLAASGEPAPEGIVYTLRDVTEERRLEEMRDDIVAVVSHELRTPLTSVYGAAQTLVALGSKLDETQRDELIKVVGEQSGRLHRILEQVLVTQRLDSGHLGLERRAFDVSERVEGVAATARAWPETRPMEVEAPGEIAAEGDPGLFEQVLVNLLDNAVKYSPPDTTIRVGVERLRASARVTVADEGPGVPAGEHDRIFEKFFRLDPDQTEGTTGTGLGLYISRELVRRMHGAIGLLPSERGATFFVDLPIHHGERA
jgi:PAS domain S-box-containing protein